MFTAKQSIIINKPPEEVWEYISNPRRFPEWQTASFSAAAAEGAEAEEGAAAGRGRVKDTRNILGRRMDHTYEINEQEHLRKLTIRTVSGPVPFQFTWTLEPVNGGTRLIGEGSGDWSGGGARITRHDDHTVSASGEAMLRGDLAALKQLLELHS